MASEKRGAVVAALAANAVIAVSKFVAAVVTGSSALLSEAFHSVADTGNQALLLFGERRSARPADERHPLGYGQEIYFWSLIVAIVLFGLGGGMSVYEGVVHLLHAQPGARGGGPWGYVVLGIAFVAEGISFAIALRKLRAQRRGRTAWRTLVDGADPRLFVPLAEDSVALAGVVVAFVGLLLSDVTGSPAWDGVASVVIGVLLGVMALLLAQASREFLIGQAVPRELRDAIRRVVSEDDEVESLGEVTAIRLAPEEVLLALAVSFRDQLSIQAAERAVLRLEARIREIHPSVRRIWLEPRG
jgi:cation diffusion facilitator family transporter